MFNRNEKNMWKAWASIPGPVKWTQCRQRFAIAATFLQSSVAQMLSHGDGPSHSLRNSAEYHVFNEDLICFSIQKLLSHSLQPEKSLQLQ